MIKSLLTLTFFFGWIASFAQSISTKEFHHYFQVAHDYDIHPPELEYGYPWWFDADSLPVSGIIFLKNELDVTLEKLNDTAWVAEPTSDNAKEIAIEIDFAPQTTLFYIIPDSNVSFSTLQVFIEGLVDDQRFSKVFLMDIKGDYTVLKYSMFSGNMSIICPKYRDVLEIDLLPDSSIKMWRRPVEQDSISSKIEYAYSVNLEKETDRTCWGRRVYSHQNILRKIDEIRKVLVQKNDPITEFELNRYLKLKEWTSKYGNITTTANLSWLEINVEIQDYQLGEFYNLLDLINYGVFNARSGGDIHLYEQLFALRQFDKIKLLHFSFPDLLLFLEKIEVPQPPFN